MHCAVHTIGLDSLIEEVSDIKSKLNYLGLAGRRHAIMGIAPFW